MIVLLIKLVIEEYINHITPYHFRLAADPAPFKNERWYRPNWMAVEFNLLYRWHGLIPSTLHGGPVWKTIFNPAIVVERGVAALIDDASRTRAGRVGAVQHRPGAARGRAGLDPRRRARCRWRPTTTTASWRASRA